MMIFLSCRWFVGGWMDGILNCDVFVVEGRDLRYGVICMPCAGEVVGIANRTTLQKSRGQDQL